jgi:hypothetical protein
MEIQRVKDMMIGQYYSILGEPENVYELLYTEISSYGGSGFQEPVYTLYFRNAKDNSFLTKYHDWDCEYEHKQI